MLLRKESRDVSWIFTIIVLGFTIIFLIIIAFSQLKHNKSLEKYKDRLYSEEINNKSNLNKIKEDNDTLNTKIKELEIKNEEYKVKLNELEQLYKGLKSKSSGIINIYDALIKAEIAKDNGDIIDSAEILRTMVNESYLLKDGSELEKRLKAEVFKPAASHFYNKGYKKYTIASYEEAIESFEKCLYYSKNENFSDDCLFFLGLSYYNINNSVQAVNFLEKLINEYSESEYISKAKDIICKVK